jgi:hypothetical protein
MNVVTNAAARIFIAVNLDRFRRSPLYPRFADQIQIRRGDDTNYAEVEWTSDGSRNLEDWMKAIGGPLLAFGADVFLVEITDGENGITSTLGDSKATTEFDDTSLMGDAADKINQIREIVG